MMDDTISRQAVIDALDSFILDEVTDVHGDTVREILERLPTIEERKTGRWIETEEQVGWETERTCECSNCGLSFPLDDWTIDEIREEMRFCYQCGARMEGE